MVKNAKIALHTQDSYKVPIKHGAIPHHVIVWYDSGSRLWFADVEDKDGNIPDVGEDYEPTELYHINAGNKDTAVDTAMDIGNWHDIPVYIKSGGYNGRSLKIRK
jgi:hypothetical protein